MYKKNLSDREQSFYAENPLKTLITLSENEPISVFGDFCKHTLNGKRMDFGISMPYFLSGCGTMPV